MTSKTETAPPRNGTQHQQTATIGQHDGHAPSNGTNGHYKPDPQGKDARSRAKANVQDVYNTTGEEPKIPRGELLEKHRKQLKKESGLSDEAIDARGYFTIAGDANGAAILREMGFDSKQSKLGECLAIPLHNWRGEIAGYAIRPTIPRNDTKGKPRKYELATGSTNTLDVAVLTRAELDNPAFDLIWTEGAKKADSAASNGLVAISVNGVYGLRGQNLKGGIANLGELDEIPLKGKIEGQLKPRRNLIVFDSDWDEKDNVYNGLFRFAEALDRRGGTVKMVTLPTGPDGKKTGLDDYFARGGTVAGLYELATDLIGVAEREKRKAETKKAARRADIDSKANALGVPIIETGGRQDVEKLQDLSAAIEKTNEKAPRLFRGFNGLIEVAIDPSGATRLKAVNRAGLQNIAAKSAAWVKTGEREGTVDVSAPRDLCEMYLAGQDNWKGVRPLEGTANAPFFAADGTLCAASGYWESARIYLTLTNGFDIGDTNPTPENTEAAKKLILETILGEVAFVDDASRAHAVAQMLLPFVRQLIDGPTPLHLWNAPLRNSGKSYGAELCIWPFTTPTPSAEKGNTEEWRKSLIVKLATGPSHVYLDNIKGSLNSSTLDAMITSQSGYFEDRLTGTGDNVTVKTSAAWVATANNARLTEDAGTRCIVIQIDPNLENPDEKKFKSDPKAFIRQNRGQVCGAIITLVRAWMEKGQLPYSGEKSFRFPQWLAVMGGIFEAIELPGILENLEEQRAHIGANAGTEWHELTELWFETHGREPKNGEELLPLAEKVTDLAAQFGESDLAKKKSKFSQLLAKRKDRIFGPYKIKAGPLVNRKVTFFIEKQEVAY